MKLNGNGRFVLLSLLVAGLLAAVIVQGVVIRGMNARMSRMVEQAQTTTRLGDETEQERHLVFPAVAVHERTWDPFDRHIDDWDPFKEMRAMQEGINQMFGGAFRRFEESDEFKALFQDYPFAPDIDIEEKDDHFLVTVDLPGAEDSQLDVKLDGQTLSISGSVQSESKETDKGKILKQERRTGKFQRIVTLPGKLESDKMTVTSDKGVMSIRIPKAKG